MHIVIIGNGVAGMEAALSVRKREPNWPITIISEESDYFFSRTALMWVCSGQLSHRCIEPLERDVYQRLNFQRIRARVTAVNVSGKTLTLSGVQEELPYDRLLIASGSKPRPGPWQGSDAIGVGHFVTMQDLEWLEEEIHGQASRGGPASRADHHLDHTTSDSPYRRRPALRRSRGGPPKHPVVIGGGLIGIEAIEVLHAAGIRPRFFIREEWFWPIALDPAESEWISNRMREQHVDVQLNENVESFRTDPNGVSGICTDKGEYPCDLAVVAIGVVPNTDFLPSEVERDRGGGIIVDEQLRTSAEDVFAAGDCASVVWFNGARRPEQLWYTSRDQGRVAARSLLGDAAHSYARGQWYNSAKLMDIEYTTAGMVNFNAAGEQNWFYEERGRVRSTNRITLSGERVIGFNFLGRRWDHSVLVRWIEEHRSLDYVLEHLNEAAFDTEFVPPLRIPRDARTQPLTGPSKNRMNEAVAPISV